MKPTNYNDHQRIWERKCTFCTLYTLNNVTNTKLTVLQHRNRLQKKTNSIWLLATESIKKIWLVDIQLNVFAKQMKI